MKWVWYNKMRVYSLPETSSFRWIVWFKWWELKVYNGNKREDAGTLQVYNWEWINVPEDWELDYYDSFNPTYIGTEEDGFIATAKFYNGDTVLETVQVKDWETPAYTGDTPTKAEDEEYTYTFAWWNPEVWPINKDVDYAATFTATPKN